MKPIWSSETTAMMFAAFCHSRRGGSVGLLENLPGSRLGQWPSRQPFDGVFRFTYTISSPPLYPRFTVFAQFVPVKPPCCTYCALLPGRRSGASRRRAAPARLPSLPRSALPVFTAAAPHYGGRSEERRVGKSVDL